MSARGEFQRLRRSLRKAGACLDTGGQDAVRRAATEFRLAASAAAVLETAGALTFAQGALIHYPCASRVPAYRAVAQEAIRDLGNISGIAGAADRPVLTRIIIETAFVHGFDGDTLSGPNRQTPVVQARQMAMLLSAALTVAVLDEISAAFGGRDHSTVLYGIRVAAARIGMNDDAALMAATILGRLSE